MRIVQELRSAWDRASPRAQLLTLTAIVIVAAVLPYLNALPNGFAYDDDFIIRRNLRVHDWQNWRAIWLTPYWPQLGAELGLYRPLTIFLFAVQWAIGGGAPWIFHAVNVALHAAVSVLVFLLLCRFVPRIPAVLGAIVFAVHPVHTEAVANVVGQAELTAGAAVLAACLLYARRPEGIEVSWRRRALLVLFYALALLAKESAVVLPGLLVLIDFMQKRVRLDRTHLIAYARALAVPVFLLVAVLLGYLIMRFDALGGTLIGHEAGPAFPYLKEHRVLNAFRAFPEYLRLLFWPADLSIDYAPAVVFAVESLTLMSAVGALLLAGVTVLTVVAIWHPRIGAAPAWFLISISPVSNIFFPIGVLIAERTLYLPSVAIAVLVAIIVDHVRTLAPRTQRQRLVHAALVACAIAALAGRTWTRNPSWKDSSTVQLTLFKEHPESYHAQWGRALAMWDERRLAESEAWFRLAFKTYDRDSGLMSTFAAFLMATGRDTEALSYLQKSHEMHPFMPNTKALLAYILITTRQFPEAFEMIAQGEALRFPATVAMPLRAYTYQGQGRLDLAASTWGHAARRIRIGKWLAHGFHARTLAFAGKDQEAREAIQEGLAIVPDSASGALLGDLGQAIDAGCFRTLDPTALEDLYGGGPGATCDPLGSWFDRIANVQGASLSQFAIPQRLQRSVQRPPR